MNIFSFFAGAGFLDLGFELQGDYNLSLIHISEPTRPY